MSLRRRLEGVASIRISQTHQTAEIEFAAGDVRFSPAEFRTALEDVGLELVRLHVEACGVIEESPPGRSLRLKRGRFLLADSDPPPTTRVVCMAGQLDDRVDPATLHVSSVTPISD